MKGFRKSKKGFQVAGNELLYTLIFAAIILAAIYLSIYQRDAIREIINSFF